MLWLVFVCCCIWTSNASPFSMVHDPYLCYPGKHIMTNITTNVTNNYNYNVTYNITANIHEYNPYNLPVKAVWCYDVDFSPQFPIFYSIVVPIKHTQSNDNSNWNIFSIYFAISENECVSPKISFRYEMVNTDTYWILNDNEQIIFDLAGNANNCQTNPFNCIQYCVINDINLNVSSIPVDSLYKISIYQHQSNNREQCTDFAIYTILTLICSDESQTKEPTTTQLETTFDFSSTTTSIPFTDTQDECPLDRLGDKCSHNRDCPSCMKCCPQYHVCEMMDARPKAAAWSMLIDMSRMRGNNTSNEPNMYGYILLVGLIAFVLINNSFICCWCLNKRKGKLL